MLLQHAYSVAQHSEFVVVIRAVMLFIKSVGSGATDRPRLDLRNRLQQSILRAVVYKHRRRLALLLWVNHTNALQFR